jgi:hypothetical protein
MAFFSWRLPKINFGKLPKLCQMAIWHNFERAVHGPLGSLSCVEESHPGVPKQTRFAWGECLAFFSWRLPKINFGKLPKLRQMAI